ncbi:AAT family amino acid transporter [Teratosphaeria destructans]|uniref:AAT family amino acid transporter n=1 Tax=Teratosphaeria destructans TaxID=418781 RepID=A0A9W7SP33_9PEZI|nr:AAT family amino acid transporter [Teratosphaeria destructans]
MAAPRHEGPAALLTVSDPYDHEKGLKGPAYDDNGSPTAQPGLDYDIQEGGTKALNRSLKGRHMQMIAIGGAIGAGFFIGSGSALSTGGPASLVICFIIVGVMLLFVMQALAELAVMYPVNGAFYQYAVRFVDPSWGFACGWDYAIQWLTILPFEISAAGITLSYWKTAAEQNIGVWITVFLVALSVIQIFGVRGYGEVEFVLSVIKVIATLGFIIMAIVIDCGGVSTDPRGYIGARYWYSPYEAFKNGFHGFCSVFVTASFAFAGTELTGLAAAEAANPLKSIPQATKQVFWRIAIFYVVGLLMVGLIVPANDPNLLNATGSNSKYSPFVIAIKLAGIKGLPSVMNAVITISVLSVANASAFGSTRTMQALAAEGMAPKFLAYVDKHGRPIYCVIIQLLFGLLAFVNEATTNGSTFFNWLLALSGLANFFIWGTICLSHIRFRAGWKYHGRGLDEIPYKAAFGVVGSWIGLAMNILCLIATFYVALFPVGGSPSAYDFFEEYLAAPLILALYVFWKLWSRDWRLYIPARDMDVTTGIRMNVDQLRDLSKNTVKEETWRNLPLRMIRAII